MLLKSCNRCGRLIPYGHAYCSECEPVVEAQREERRLEAKRRNDRIYNKNRNPKFTKFYRSSDWRRLSMRYTQDRQFRCEQCGDIATQVHHKVPIQTTEGWERRLDYDNLELLCTRCHNERHERFRPRVGKIL